LLPDIQTLTINPDKHIRPCCHGDAYTAQNVVRHISLAADRHQCLAVRAVCHLARALPDGSIRISGQGLPGVAVIGGMALLFWFRFYAQERQSARVFAAMTGCFTLVLLLVSVLTDAPQGSIGDRHVRV
jgi:hypothetical protein